MRNPWFKFVCIGVCSGFSERAIFFLSNHNHNPRRHNEPGDNSNGGSIICIMLALAFRAIEPLNELVKLTCFRDAKLQIPTELVVERINGVEV